MKHYCKECGRLVFESYWSEEDDETFDEEYECDCAVTETCLGTHNGGKASGHVTAIIIEPEDRAGQESGESTPRSGTEELEDE